MKKSLLKKYSLECKKYILLTLHRPANVDDSGKLKEILQAVIKAEENIIFPVHPRTKKQINKITNDLKNLKNFSNIKLIKPVAYTEMVILEKNAKKICTDSGGVQKEAYWLKIPCITLLESQGWPELHDDGWNLLVGTNFAKIRDGIKKFNPQKKQKKHFGDGDASRKIIRILKRYFMIYD
jgi:UDP-N-acetylglucosamine 2-epimerase (non-hydrolysing)